MTPRPSRLARDLSEANVFERTRTLSEWATSRDATHRRAVAEALATGAGDLGALTAVQLLSRDADEGVRIAAVTAAAVRFETVPRAYGSIVRAACHDPSRAVRRVAVAALRKAIELGHARGAAPALLRCAGIDDRVTQALAIDALGELANVMPRRALEAMAELVDELDRIDPAVHRVLRERLETLRPIHPRRVRRLVRRIAGPSQALARHTQRRTTSISS